MKRWIRCYGEGIEYYHNILAGRNKSSRRRRFCGEVLVWGDMSGESVSSRCVESISGGFVSSIKSLYMKVVVVLLKI